MTALIEETFYQELLTKPLSQYPMQISFPTLQQNPAQLVELRCFQALRQIKEIISEPTLSDAECFQRIEAGQRRRGAARFFISPPHHSQKQRRGLLPPFFSFHPKQSAASARQVPLCITSSVCIPDRHTPTGFPAADPQSAGPGQKRCGYNRLPCPCRRHPAPLPAP